MRKLILFSLPLLCFAQSSNYPSALDGDSSLFVTADNVQSTISAAMTSGDSTATVASSTGFAANMIATICDVVTSTGKCTTFEHMKVTAVNGNVLTVTRGFAGTVARAHSSGKLISILIDSAHISVLKSAVVNIETALGVNLSNVTQYRADLYDFAAQTPGGSLIVGANTITLSPVPPGVNGTDSGHYLYISGGTGTAEAVLIIGGTAVAGAASGTVIVTCANTHSGAWTIQSATDGGAEAAQAAGTGGTVTFPAGTYHLKATLAFRPGQAVRGAGKFQTVIIQDFASGDAFKLDNTGYSINGTISYTGSASISGFFFTNSTAISGGWFIDFIGGDGQVSDIYFAGGANDLLLDGATRVDVYDIVSYNQTGIGIQVGGSNGASGPTISGWQMSSSNNNAVGLKAVYGLFNLTNFDIQMPGTSTKGILLQPGVGQQVAELTISNGIIDSAATAFQAIATSGPIFTIQMSNVYLSNGSAPTGSVAIGMSGVTGAHFTNVLTNYSNSSCIVQLIGGGGISFNGFRSGNAQNASNTCGIFIGQSTATAGVTITGSDIGVNLEGTNDTNYAIGVNIETGSDAVTIVGNHIVGSTAPIVNNATLTKAVINNNSGLDDVIPSAVASATSIAAPLNPVFPVSGNTAITTITGGWPGRRITVYKTDAATVAIGGGGNIPLSRNLAQNASVVLTFNGTNWY